MFYVFMYIYISSVRLDNVMDEVVEALLMLPSQALLLLCHLDIFLV